MHVRYHRCSILFGIILSLCISLDIHGDSVAGSVFHFTDKHGEQVVMQAEFPAPQVCEFFKQMALDEPDPNKYQPGCSSNKLDSQLPVSAVVDYGQLGFSVPYRFDSRENCEEFVREFKQTIVESNIDEGSSRLAQDCSE